MSSTNYFEDHPVLSRIGAPTVFTGDSSEVITQEAIEFMADAAAGQEPFFAAIWFGAPHTPWMSVYRDTAEVTAANPSDQSRRQHHGEIVGIDNSVGAMRAFLNDAGLADNTIIWFLSDNGSVEQNGAAGTGGLRGHKSTLWEGGIRVPSVVEWPGAIRPGTSDVPASVMDFAPTMAALAGFTPADWDHVLDGEDITQVLAGDAFAREAPLFFRHRGQFAIVDGSLKAIASDINDLGTYQLFDLSSDPNEVTDLSATRPDTLAILQDKLLAWQSSVSDSMAGADYGERNLTITPPDDVNSSAVYSPFVQAIAQAVEQRSLSNRLMRRARSYLGPVAALLAILIGAGVAWRVMSRRRMRRT